VAAYFVDSSGLVKRYVRELGTAWVTSIVRPSARNSIHVARITGVEVVAALTRRRRSGALSAGAFTAVLTRFRAEYAKRFQLLAVTPRLLLDAMLLAERYALRGYDAVQLAAALRVRDRRSAQRLSRVTLISADTELNAAATAEGLAVDNPNNHP
jgi:predicted nucleic acid-binding protein